MKKDAACSIDHELSNKTLHSHLMKMLHVAYQSQGLGFHGSQMGVWNCRNGRSGTRLIALMWVGTLVHSLERSTNNINSLLPECIAGVNCNNSQILCRQRDTLQRPLL
jgi:hypothetical protein